MIIKTTNKIMLDIQKAARSAMDDFIMGKQDYLLVYDREKNMQIEFRNKTQAGNNVRVDMAFDGIIVSCIQCTPLEFKHFVSALKADMWLEGGVVEVVEEA